MVATAVISKEEEEQIAYLTQVTVNQVEMIENITQLLNIAINNDYQTVDQIKPIILSAQDRLRELKGARAIQLFKDVDYFLCKDQQEEYFHLHKTLDFMLNDLPNTASVASI